VQLPEAIKINGSGSQRVAGYGYYCPVVFGTHAMPRCLLPRFLRPLSFFISPFRAAWEFKSRRSADMGCKVHSAFCILQVQDSGVGVTRRSDDNTIGFKAR